jgi:ArsR family transcriptional regulator, arsenate/arsenite/antimonite-responsive transcriptional repressor
MAEVTDSEAALIGKALGDPTRLGIYTQIANHRELFCGELNACQTIYGATISHHLRVLTHAGLIQSRRSGQHIYYRAIPSRLVAYRRYLSNLGRLVKRLEAQDQ